MNDPYLYPSTGVLRNKLNIADADELARAEGILVALRDTQVAASPIPGAYDLDHLRRFHRRLFSDVYTWAGKRRTVDITKDGMPFCFHNHIEAYATSTVFPLIVELDYLRGRDHASTVEALAQVLAEVNALHPFREGNGRTQRAFFRQMAAAAGWRVDWAAADPDENIAASRAAMSKNLDALQGMLEPLVKPA